MPKKYLNKKFYFNLFIAKKRREREKIVKDCIRNINFYFFSFVLYKISFIISNGVYSQLPKIEKDS